MMKQSVQTKELTQVNVRTAESEESMLVPAQSPERSFKNMTSALLTIGAGIIVMSFKFGISLFQQKKIDFGDGSKPGAETARSEREIKSIFEAKGRVEDMNCAMKAVTDEKSKVIYSSDTLLAVDFNQVTPSKLTFKPGQWICVEMSSPEQLNEIFRWTKKAGRQATDRNIFIFVQIVFVNAGKIDTHDIAVAEYKLSRRGVRVQKFSEPTFKEAVELFDQKIKNTVASASSQPWRRQLQETIAGMG